MIEDSTIVESSESKDEKIQQQQSLIEKLQATVKAVKNIFNDDQIRKLENPVKRIHWSDQTIQDAIQVYVMSGGTTYDFLRTTMHLPYPHLNTLRRHLKDIKCQPGILGDFFTLMQKKVDLMAPQEKMCSLILDEMAIKPKKEYDRSTDSIIGYPTINESQNRQKKRKGHMREHDYAKPLIPRETLATHALAFMLCGIHANR